jgi:acetyl-CoA carboxylase biotin carboxyl carrier protein
VTQVTFETPERVRPARLNDPEEGNRPVSQTVDNRRLTELRSLLQVIEDAGWEYARVEIDGVALVVSSDPEFVAGSVPAAGSAPTPAPTTAAPPAVTPVAAEAAPPAAAPAPVAPAPTEAAPSATDGPVETVTSPTIGLFWRSPKPGAPPFVNVGDAVAAGDTVCIIEVMKLMTHVTAPVAGTIRAIRIDNGAMVEHGTELVDIEPAEAAQ